MLLLWAAIELSMCDCICWLFASGLDFKDPPIASSKQKKVTSFSAGRRATPTRTVAILLHVCEHIAIMAPNSLMGDTLHSYTTIFDGPLEQNGCKGWRKT